MRPQTNSHNQGQMRMNINNTYSDNSNLNMQPVTEYFQTLKDYGFSFKDFAEEYPNLAKSEYGQALKDLFENTSYRVEAKEEIQMVNYVTRECINITVMYYELSNYNNGTLMSKTFDLDGTDQESHLEEVRDWLEELTEETGSLCEEAAIADSTGVPSLYVNRNYISSEFWDYLDLIDTLSADIVQAGLECGIELDCIEDAYYGAYDSAEDFAQEYIDSTGMLSDVPDSLVQYFDIERFASDLMYDYTECDGFYFSNYY